MAGQRVGYIRVSSLDQHTDRQLDGIELDRVFTDAVIVHSMDPCRLGAVSLGQRILGGARWERIWERNAAQPRRRHGTGRHGLDGRLAVT